MTKCKKVFTAAVSLALLVCMSLAMLPGGLSTARAVTKQTAIEDNFNYQTLDSTKWETKGESDKVKLTDGGGALQMYGGQFHKVAAWMGNSVDGESGKGVPITGSYVMEAVISRESGDGEWIGIYSGMSSSDLDFQTIKGDSKDAAGNLLVINSVSITNYANQLPQGDPINVAMNADGTPYKIKLDYVKGATYAQNKVDIYIVEYNPLAQGEYVKQGTVTGISIDGYFAFGSTTTIASVSQLKITQNGVVHYETDFKGDLIDFIYGGMPADTTKEFRVWCSKEKEFAHMFQTGQVSSVSLMGSADSVNMLTAKLPIVEDKDVVDILDVSFSIKPLKTLGKFGVAFGSGNGNTGRVVMQTTEVETVKSTKIFVENSNGEKVGEELDLGEDITVAAFRKFKLSAKLGGKVDVSFQGRYLGQLTGIESFAGAMSFFVEENATVEVDDVIANVYSKTIEDGRYLATDFSRLKEDGSVYLNTTDDFYTSGNVFLRKNMASFTNAIPGSVFGPRDKYGDFVLKFDILNITQGVNNGGEEGVIPSPRCSWFGVSFGRTSRDQDALTTTAFMFAPRPVMGADKVTTMQIEALNTTFDNNSTTKTLKENFYEDGKLDEGKKRINVVIVASNRTLSIYYKYSNEPDWVLDTPKAVITDVNTYGYVAIVCNYGGNFSVSNFSIVNTTATNGAIGDYKDMSDANKVTNGSAAVGI